MRFAIIDARTNPLHKMRSANDSQFDGRAKAFQVDYRLPDAGEVGSVACIAHDRTKAIDNLSKAFGDQPFGVKVKDLLS